MPVASVNPWGNLFGSQDTTPWFEPWNQPSQPGSSGNRVQWPTFPTPSLPSTQTVPPGGGVLPTGGAGADLGDPDSTKAKVGNLAGAVAPLLISLFGNNPYKSRTEAGATQLQQLSAALGAQGKATAQTGTEALSPVLRYLMAVAGGDPSALLQATQPERGRILDQYDTARKNLMNLPRGGGQAGAAAQLEVGKARDLADTTATARREGVSQLGQLGQNLLQFGGQEQAYSLQGLEGALQAFERLSAGQDAQLAGLGKALGAALPFIIAAVV
jgi:hypothetical protein